MTGWVSRAGLYAVCVQALVPRANGYGHRSSYAVLREWKRVCLHLALSCNDV